MSFNHECIGKILLSLTCMAGHGLLLSSLDLTEPDSGGRSATRESYL